MSIYRVVKNGVRLNCFEINKMYAHDGTAAVQWYVPTPLHAPLILMRVNAYYKNEQFNEITLKTFENNKMGVKQINDDPNLWNCNWKYDGMKFNLSVDTQENELIEKVMKREDLRTKWNDIVKAFVIYTPNKPPGLPYKYVDAEEDVRILLS